MGVGGIRRQNRSWLKKFFGYTPDALSFLVTPRCAKAKTARAGGSAVPPSVSADKVREFSFSSFR
jgi:hypothetical protein